MTTCQQFQQELVALLAENLSPEQKSQMEGHAQTCSACAAELEELRGVWNSMEIWQEQPLPNSLATSIVEQAHAAGQTPVVAMAVRKRWNERFLPIAPFGMGLVTAIATAAILSLRTNLDLIHPLGLTVAGALWTVLYGVVFYLFAIGQRQDETSWKFLGQASLVAVGIFLLLTFISPVPSSVRFCSNYALTQPFVEKLSIGGRYFLFGSFYAMIPMAIASYLSASSALRRNSPILRGSLAGGMFVMLLAPSIFLQCAPFALGVLLGWFGGALVGSIVGGAIGYWVRCKLA
jgi:hypothetical protein